MPSRTDPARTTRRQRGATAVEFAVVAALVLALVFGILEYGLIFLQEHYIANAAREGARIGVRANNYDCFDTIPADRFTSCTSSRKAKTENKIREYLGIFNYAENELTIVVEKPSALPANDNGKTLIVTVEAKSFAPGLVSGLLKALRAGSNVKNPELVTFTTSMTYEDPREYDAEND
jgi:hypothetical protein